MEKKLFFLYLNLIYLNFLGSSGTLKRTFFKSEELLVIETLHILLSHSSSIKSKIYLPYI